MNRLRKDRGPEKRLPPLKCPIHGEQKDIAVICRHLADAECNEGFRHVAPSDAPYREIAWCTSCEEIRQKAGGWRWEDQERTELKLVCFPCYQGYLARHDLILKDPPE
jgi:hypothetical protein